MALLSPRPQPITTATTQSASSWLTPDELADLTGVELRAAGIVEGFMQGLHRSPFVGYSVEFSSHRKYAAGDDPRHVNWKLYARNRRLYVKEFDAETNLNLYLIVDCSKSMQCRAGSSLSKWQYATAIAGALSQISLRQRDAVGLSLIADGVIEHLEPSAKPGRWSDIVRILDSSPQPVQTDLSRSLAQAAELARHRGVVVVLSDLMDDPEQALEGLRQLRFRQHEVLLFHLLDPWERWLPEPGRVRFRDLESSLEVTTETDAVRQAYVKRIDDWCQTLRGECLRQSIDLIQVTTDQPPTEVLVDYLVQRSNQS
ncbi:MAG: DUF58 domain-containing protein [Pirellulales bacterium]|nr:DUF58 domain-containing protein [Pirellulales bacterium]